MAGKTSSKSDMIAKGKRKYIANVDADKWRSCGAEGGMATAVCLKGMKAALTTADWATRWETAMG